MTLTDEIFKYITIKNDEYFLVKDTPNEMKQKIKDYCDDVKKLYGEIIIVHGL